MTLGSRRYKFLQQQCTTDGRGGTLFDEGCEGIDDPWNKGNEVILQVTRQNRQQSQDWLQGQCCIHAHRSQQDLHHRILTPTQHQSNEFTSEPLRPTMDETWPA